MTQRERKVFHNCKIMEKGVGEHNGKEAWKVTLNKEVFGGKYDLICTRVEPEIANRLQPGQQYSLVLERENKKKPEYDGERDWMWYWGLVGIADADDAPQGAQQDARPTDGAAPRQQTTTSSESWGNLDQRIAWNSAINNGVHATPYAEMTLSAWLGEVDGIANSLYPLIRRGPLPPATRDGDAPEGGPDAPDGDDEDVLFLEDALDSQEPLSEGRV